MYISDEGRYLFLIPFNPFTPDNTSAIICSFERGESILFTEVVTGYAVITIHLINRVPDIIKVYTGNIIFQCFGNNRNPVCSYLRQSHVVSRVNLAIPFADKPPGMFFHGFFKIDLVAGAEYRVNSYIPFFAFVNNECKKIPVKIILFRQSVITEQVVNSYFGIPVKQRYYLFLTLCFIPVKKGLMEPYPPEFRFRLLRGIAAGNRKNAEAENQGNP